MRKCVACGYLVLGDSELCKHCGALLPPVAAAALVSSGAPTAAPLPPPPPAPPPPAPPMQAPVPAPAPPPPAPVGRAPVAREYWSPPEVPGTPTAARRSSNGMPRAVLAIVSILSMALGWVAFDHFTHSDPLPAGTSDFVAGRGVSYSAPDHSFEAKFPETPIVDHRMIPLQSTSVPFSIAQVETDDYEVVAASLELPAPVPDSQVDPELRLVMNNAADAQGAKIESVQHVVENGVSGIEARAKIADGYDARIMLLISGQRIYMLGVHAKSGTGRLFDALVASLVMY